MTLHDEILRLMTGHDDRIAPPSERARAARASTRHRRVPVHPSHAVSQIHPHFEHAAPGLWRARLSELIDHWAAASEQPPMEIPAMEDAAGGR